METTEEKLKELIVDQVGVDIEDITPKSRFIEDLGLDSLDTVELVMAVEEGFNIEISDEEAEKITTFGEALAYIEGKVK